MPGDLPDIVIPPPARGLLEGLDPALEGYPLEAAPDLENIRVESGLWECRLGMVLSIAAAGSGPGRFLTTHYTNDGSRYRLMARGSGEAAVLYKLLADTDSSWQEVTGGTGLGNAGGETFQGVSLGGRFYLTDRQNALKSWDPSDNTLSPVSQPVAPVQGPRVIPRTYALLDGFSGSAPYGWVESDGTNFDLTTYADSDLPAAGSYGTSTVRRLLAKGGALNDTVTKNRPEFPVPSQAIAFWMEQSIRGRLVVLEYGITAAAQFSVTLNPEEKDITYPVFVPLGSIGTLSYLRFRALRNPDASRSTIFGPLILPGNLQGQYRWVYTHYDPASGEESAPSPFSNDGEFSNFSSVGISYDESTAVGEGSALYKSAAVIPESDSDTDSASTRIRLYRQGGVAELTKSASGQDILTRIGEIPDVVTTVSTTASAGAREVVLATVGNAGGDFADGDGLLLDGGVDGKEEVARIAHYRLWDLTASAARTLTSATRPFTAADVGGEIVISGQASGSTGLTPGTYTIQSVASNVATLTADVATSTPAQNGYGYLNAVNSGTRRVCLADGLSYTHTAGASVQACFLDNVADAAVDASHTLEGERDGPPSGVHCVDRAPDGRLWLFGWPQRPLGIAVSNKPTPERARDFEVFPDGVDPFTRRSLTQGFRFDLSGDASGDAVVWGGFFRQNATVLTRKGLWQVYAAGQSDWGPTSVVKVVEVGCIAGDTVRIVNDTLYWVAPGPRVMRWDGNPAAEPQDVSFRRVNATLADAPAAYWSKWWAQAHADKRGAYYRLWIVPNGGTTPTKRLDYNLVQDAWEPVVYYDSGGTALPFACGTVLDVSSDTGELLALHATSGITFQQETGTTDAGPAIRVRAQTKKIGLGGAVSLVKAFWLRLAAATDSLSVSITTGGSQYGDVTNAHAGLSVSGSGDREVKQRVAFNQKGRWVQFTLTGALSDRASLRELGVWFSRIRSGRLE